MKLLDRVAVITGGNSGVGLATAREFQANGAKVAIFGRSRETLGPVAASLGDSGLAIQGDVRSLGMTDTPIITREGGSPGVKPEDIAAIITKTIPLRRRGTPEQMASRAIPGLGRFKLLRLESELLVDGGLTQLVNP